MQADRKQPIILAIDSSAAHCAAALVAGDGGEEVLASRVELMAKGQVERLAVLVDELLSEAGIKAADLDAIAICIGPGNFTGIRIALSLGRGLALAAGCPAIGISRLEALALSAPERLGKAMKWPVGVSVDARRGRLYWQCFDAQNKPLATPVLIDAEALSKEASGDAVAASIVGPLAQEAAEEVVSDMVDPICVARLAAGRIDQPHERPAPLYMRPADAAPGREQAPVILDAGQAPGQL